MYRCFACFVSVALLFAGCSSAPRASSSSSLVKYGAGGMEEDPSHAARASAPGGIQRVRMDEVLAQAKMHEADLDERLAALDFSGALVSFDAISDLVGGIPSASSRLQEVRQRVETALDSVVLEPAGSPAETSVGAPFKKDFQVRAFAVSADQKKPLPSFELLVAWPGATADGEPAAQSASVRTQGDGLASFSAPAPSRAGKGKLQFSSALSSRDPVLAASLAKRKESGKLSLSFPHLVATNARSLPTTIAILDFDKGGKPVGSSGVTAMTVLKPLVQRGFRRIGMADFPAQLASGDEEALIKAARAQFGSGVQRFIYGTTKVDSLVQATDGNWSCTVSAKVSVWDFTLDRVVYSTVVSRTETGKTEAAALDAARKKIAGEDIVNDLYYNM